MNKFLKTALIAIFFTACLSIQASAKEIQPTYSPPAGYPNYCLISTTKYTVVDQNLLSGTLPGAMWGDHIYMRKGHYAVFNVTVRDSGKYELTLNSGSKRAHKYNIYINDKIQITTDELAESGEYTTFVSEKVGSIVLDEGLNTVKIEINDISSSDAVYFKNLSVLKTNTCFYEIPNSFDAKTYKIEMEDSGTNSTLLKAEYISSQQSYCNFINQTDGESSLMDYINTAAFEPKYIAVSKATLEDIAEYTLDNNQHVRINDLFSPAAITLSAISESADSYTEISKQLPQNTYSKTVIFNISTNNPVILAKNIAYIVAGYDNNDCLKQVLSFPHSSFSNKTCIKINNFDSVCYYKLFVMNSLNNIMPYTECVSWYN